MNQFVDQAGRFAQMWADFASRTATATLQTLSPSAGAPPPDVARQFRDATLQSLAAATEQFMRSPEFLALMKQSLDASVALRQQFNEFFTRMHHGVQGVARQDIDVILLAVRHTEQRTLDRIEELADRIDRIARRLDALAPAAAESNGQPAAAPAEGRLDAGKPRKGPRATGAAPGGK